MPADADVAAETDFGFRGDRKPPSQNGGSGQRQENRATGTRGGFRHAILSMIDDDSRP